MPRRQTPIVNPDATKTLYRQPKGFDPSQKMKDVVLSPGWYLLQGCEIKEGSEQETEGGIFMVVGDENTHNTAQVVAKSAEGCTRADIGDYVPMPAYGGNEHDDKKALPWIRFLGDDESLWLIHDDNILAKLPPRKK